MRKRKGLGVVVLLTASMVSCATGRVAEPDTQPSAPEDEAIVSPFGGNGVAGFDDDDVRAYAKTVTGQVDDADENAAQWSTVGEPGSFDSIDGDWASRWRFSKEGQDRWWEGVAIIKSVGSRVFVKYDDAFTYMIEAERQGDRLVGRYQSLVDADDSHPWVGIIVSNERIDGFWPEGRWDFRRGGGTKSEETAP